MRDLAIKFKKRSRIYTQIHREGDEFYIYEVIDNTNDVPDTYYEVFSHKIGGMHPLSVDYNPDEKVVRYPRNEDFGYWAWCCSNWNCVLKVLRQHYDYTDKEIRFLGLHNAKLAALIELVDNCPTDGEKSDF